MNVVIYDANKDEPVEGLILDGAAYELPDIHKGWRFDFAKYSKGKDTYTYVLVTKLNPEVIQGCLIYKMLNSEEPYMAYLELAPHNRGDKREFVNIAGCLIAYACRLSFKLGEGYFTGWLAFDVKEERKEDEVKLMNLYSVKYGAKRLGDTTMMLIEPVKGEELIKEFLNR